jgi:hypothetical protein
MNRLSRYVDVGENTGYRITVDDAGHVTLMAQQGPPGLVSDLTVIPLALTRDQCNELIGWLTQAASLAEE